jgi:uncharacterized protein YjbI with pentapeptide repeats
MMADKEHLRVIKQGWSVWNEWRKDNSSVDPDLSGADLRKVKYPNPLGMLRSMITYRHAERGIDFSSTNLAGANLSGTNLLGADFGKAVLTGADIQHANVRYANFNNAILNSANLTSTALDESNFQEAKMDGAICIGAGLRGCNFVDASLVGANLEGAKLQRARMVKTNLKGSNLAGCSVYGLSAWDLNLEQTTQTNLSISPDDTSAITVDNLEVAQFIYLILNNWKVRDIIDTITSKAVLILGRFTPERKEVLDALRDKLRGHDYLPILFDFDKPESRNLTETVSTLAHMSRFVIADITDAKSIPQELQRIVPSLPSLPVQPIILASQFEYSMFKDLMDYPWVLKPYRYDTLEGLLSALESMVIAPAVGKAEEIRERRQALL